MKTVLLTGCIKNPLTGIGRYTLELVKQFDAMRSGVCFVGGEGEKYKIFDDKQQNYKSNEGKGLLKRIVTSSETMVQLYALLKEYYCGFQLRKYENCLIHSPNFYFPYTNNKIIVTIHDLSMFLYPECFESGVAGMMQKICKKSISKADALITVSNSVKKQICEMFDYPKDLIYVTHLAGGKDFHPRSDKDCFQVLNRYGLLYKSYVLVVGTIEPRKNLLTIINAYTKLPEKVRIRNPLVIVGFSGWRSAYEHYLIQKGQKEGWIKYLSYVSENDLYVLYSGCKLFCFPSKYEGFGIPLVEAMNSGSPVLCSDITVFREIGLDAPCYIEVDNIDQWRESILESLSNDDLLTSMSDKSISQGARFSWEQCAKQTLNAYSDTLRN